MIAILISIFTSVSSILSMLGMWLVFEKAGEKGWKAIIPFYNMYTLFKLSDKQKYWTMYLYGVVVYTLSTFTLIFITLWAFLMFLISLGEIDLGLQYISTINPFTICLFIGFVVGCILMLIPTIQGYIGVCHKMHQSSTMALGLFFLSPVFWMLLGASDKYQWEACTTTSRNTPQQEPTVDNHESIYEGGYIMAQFFVPTRLRPYEAANQMMPHNTRVPYMHFEREEQAQAYLNRSPYPNAYYGIHNTEKPIMFGPGCRDRVEWPRLESIYRVEVTEPAKLQMLKDSSTTLIGIGTAGRIALNPNEVLSRTTTIYPTVLHEKAWVEHEEPHFGEHIQNKDIAEQLLQRGQELQRLYHILERSGAQEREMLDMQNPEHAELMRKVCCREHEGKDLEERLLLEVQRQIGAQCGVRTVLSTSAIEAEFNEQLNAQDPNTPAAERIAVAMTSTLQKFAATIPAKDAPAVQDVAEKVHSTVHEMEAEVDARDETVHEVGAEALDIRDASDEIIDELNAATTEYDNLEDIEHDDI